MRRNSRHFHRRQHSHQWGYRSYQHCHTCSQIQQQQGIFTHRHCSSREHSLHLRRWLSKDCQRQGRPPRRQHHIWRRLSAPQRRRRQRTQEHGVSTASGTRRLSRNGDTERCSTGKPVSRSRRHRAVGCRFRHRFITSSTTGILAGRTSPALDRTRKDQQTSWICSTSHRRPGRRTDPHEHSYLDLQ